MKKILLIVALTLMSVIAFGQKGYEKIERDTVGVLIKDPINGTFVANGMEKIRNALLGSIAKILKNDSTSTKELSKHRRRET